MKLLVFGKTGQVATELQRRAPEAAFLGRAEADLSDPAACAAAIHARAPDAVINAAAYTAVDRAEEEEALAHRINADAPGAMAKAAAEVGAAFLHISTDYVFDGSGDEARAESAPTAPLNAYGRTKLAGELAVRAAHPNALILRTSWVVSAHGQNFIKTMLRLSETRDTLTIVADQIGGPTPAGAIAEALIRCASAMQDGAQGGTYHFAGAPHTSWADFARAIFAAAGRDVTVTDIPTTGYPTPATRPLNSRLDCTAITRDFGIKAPDWRAALPGILKELNI
ncbi:MAG: dTDP-4-dehydrorhamnose reductase [Pseudomonadota bacterium]